jgi:hypothetical protein
MVIFGSNPMNEYWASFSGPSMDSKRYVVWYFFWSFENISSGCWLILIFFIFRALADLVIVVCVPNAIPHFVLLPDGSEAYVSVLFKAYQYRNVRYGRTPLNQSK